MGRWSHNSPVNWIVPVLVAAAAYLSMPRQAIQTIRIVITGALLVFVVGLYAWGRWSSYRVFHVDQLPPDDQKSVDDAYERAFARLDDDETAGEAEVRRAHALELERLDQHLVRCRERALRSQRDTRRYRAELLRAMHESEALDRENARLAGAPDPLETELGIAIRARFQVEVSWAERMLSIDAMS